MCVGLDAMVALFDRRAGVTHLLAEPGATVLDALGAGDASVDEIACRLGVDAHFDNGADAEALIAERLDELCATGLVERL